MDAHGHILVVEDDPIIQRFITAMLEGAGYSVVCAEDGEAGWQALSEGSFDLLITDNNMPKLTGVEMIRRLRAVTLTMPIILISGDIPRGVKDLSALLTPGLALQKPFTMSQLLGQVRANLVSVGSPI